MPKKQKSLVSINTRIPFFWKNIVIFLKIHSTYISVVDAQKAKNVWYL
jgi:hypothetical protein